MYVFFAAGPPRKEAGAGHRTGNGNGNGKKPVLTGPDGTKVNVGPGVATFMNLKKMTNLDVIKTNTKRYRIEVVTRSKKSLLTLQVNAKKSNPLTNHLNNL